MGKGMRAGKKKKVGGGAGNMQQQMKQLQAMQRGAVEVTVNGNKEITKLVIDRDVVDPDDVEMLQDLIMAAVNEGMRQIDAIAENEMGKVTGGLNIPGLGL